MRRVKVNVQGQPVEADEVEFEPVKESWNEYRLEDGTRLRARLITQKILRLIDRFTDSGEPVYVISSTNVLVADVPPQLMKPQP